MKKIMILTVASLAMVSCVASRSASADVSGITARLGGGCLTANTAGKCVIKGAASGTDLESEGVQLYAGKDAKSLKRVTSRVTSLSDAGTFSLSVRNISGGCYQVRTSDNGNDKPDARSRTVCE